MEGEEECKEEKKEAEGVLVMVKKVDEGRGEEKS